MKIALNLPWEKYGLIAELAFRLKCLNLRFGKTALQKFVYLLQELYDIKAGYDFSLYTYGPFSSDLLSDLDFVESLDGVNVNFLPEIQGYEISPGKANESIREKATEFLKNAKGKIDRIIEDFGHFTAKDLELRSTIIFVNRDLKRKGQTNIHHELINLVQDIKPHFNKNEISDALSELENKGYILV
jgi:uncharacterized protein YwgA